MKKKATLIQKRAKKKMPKKSHMPMKSKIKTKRKWKR
jgi:hypothetical protein